MSFGLKELKTGVNTSKDASIIPNYVTGLQQGIQIYNTYSKDIIPIATPVYLKEGKFLTLEIKSDGKTYEELPEDVKLVGVTRSTVSKDDNSVGVMDIGVVYTPAMDVKYSATLLKALSDNLKISFREWL